MAVSLLAQRWDQLDWESFSGSNKQKRRSNEGLKIEVEEKNKKLRKWKERVLNEKKKIENFKEEKDENIFLNTYESWSDLNSTFNSIISSKSPTPSQPSTSIL